MQLKFTILILVFAFLLTSCAIVTIVYAEVDKTSTVSSVTDGDTFKLYTGETIRLADVDCPEYYESGYSEATEYLASLIDGEVVYLDIDDIYWTDKYDRLVCVVYVGYNSTHWINVNKALLDGEYASVADYDNEFNPDSWTYFSEAIRYPKTSPPKFPPTSPPQPTPFYSPFLTTILETLVVSAILFLVIVGIVFMVKRRKKN